MSQGTTREARIRRHGRIRRKVTGTPQRPRLSVFRSSKHIYAQIIDDSSGRTLVAASDGEPALRTGDTEGKDKTGRASIVGKELAARARAAGIEQVVFDRGGFRYHGRVKALAEAAREGGLGF